MSSPSPVSTIVDQVDASDLGHTFLLLATIGLAVAMTVKALVWGWRLVAAIIDTPHGHDAGVDDWIDRHTS